MGGVCCCSLPADGPGRGDEVVPAVSWGDRPFDRQGLRRAQREVLGVQPDALEVPIATAENVVLARLEWFRLGGEVSEGERRDAVGILRVSAQMVDTVYLARWAEASGMTDRLARGQPAGSP